MSISLEIFPPDKRIIGNPLLEKFTEDVETRDESYLEYLRKSMALEKQRGSTKSMQSVVIVNVLFIYHV